MPYVNRAYPICIYCPAIKKKVMVKEFSHHDDHNPYANKHCGHHCLEENCPLANCKCKYEDGKLTLRG